MQNPVITNHQEVSDLATRLKGNDFATREQQVWLLTMLLNGGVNLMRAFGVQPYVTVEYLKVTDCAPRIAGQDFKRAPGMMHGAHAGPVVKAWRTKGGNLVLRVADSLRQDWTCVRIEGIDSIIPGMPMTQAGLVGPVPVGV